MIENFHNSLRWVLEHEGGYVNHPDDPGGATNRGVTQRVYDGYRKRKQKPTQSVLEITSDEVTDIYRRQYWSAVRGDELPAGLDYCVFDFAVNSGPRRAIQFMQRELGVSDDGIIGEITMGEIDRLSPTNVGHVCSAICTDRLAWLKRLRHWSTFGRGWTRRVEDVRKRSVALADKVRPPVEVDPGDYLAGVPIKDPMGKAEGPERITARASDQKGPLAAAGASILGGVSTVITAVSEAPLSIQIAVAAVIVMAGAAAVVYFLRGQSDGAY